MALTADDLDRLRAAARIRARRNGQPVAGALERELQQVLQRLQAACDALSCAAAALAIAQDQVDAVDAWERGGGVS